MAIVRWEPFRDMIALEDRLNRLFQQGLGPLRDQESMQAWAPPVDIYETEKEIVLKADLPDVKPEDVDIRLENNTLTLRGERRFEKDVKDENYHRVERQYGSFSRTFSLPTTVDADKIDARYESGVLRVVLPKREEARPKQIRVKAA